MIAEKGRSSAKSGNNSTLADGFYLPSTTAEQKIRIFLLVLISSGISLDRISHSLFCFLRGLEDLTRVCYLDWASVGYADLQLGLRRGCRQTGPATEVAVLGFWRAIEVWFYEYFLPLPGACSSWPPLSMLNPNVIMMIPSESREGTDFRQLVYPEGDYVTELLPLLAPFLVRRLDAVVTFVPPRLVLRYEGPIETVEECVPDAPEEWRQAEQSLPGSVASVSHERVRKLLRVIDNLHYQLVRRSHYRTCRNADVARPPLQPSSRAGDSAVRSPPKQRSRGERGESSRQGEVRERAAGATPGIAPQWGHVARSWWVRAVLTASFRHDGSAASSGRVQASSVFHSGLWASAFSFLPGSVL